MGDTLVLDLETQKSFDEVGGRENFHLLGVSVAGLYSYRSQAFRTFIESEITSLLPVLESAELVIGFNVKRFDYAVLEPYFKRRLAHLRTLDILEEVTKTLGHRLSLDSLVSATLGRKKLGSGLDALKYFKAGRMDKLKEYCLEDVRLTRDLYEYGKRHGRLLYYARRGLEIAHFPVSWGDRTGDILQRAFQERLTVEIVYTAQVSSDKNNLSKTIQLVDVYDLAENYFVGHAHLSGRIETFDAGRVSAVKITEKTFEVPAAFNAIAYWNSRTLF
jgi:DEAD/DEAH box helicase domain-containing protein